jgi:hypothetical protein
VSKPNSWRDNLGTLLFFQPPLLEHPFPYLPLQAHTTFTTMTVAVCKYYYSFFLCVSLLLASTKGFSFENLFQPPKSIKPDLLQITEKQQDQLLKIHLNIVGHDDGDEQEDDSGPPHMMAVKDLLVELHHEPAEYDHTSLPGANGPHHKLSSGHRRLDVISEGQYINMQGMQKVQMTKGCWEMCWRKDKPAGTLICGFDVPHDYRRNEAVLPQGEIFVSFPLWTKEGLKIGQDEKRKVEVQLERFLEERDDALVKFEETENPIMKALFFQSAMAALEKYNNVDHHTMETIPMDHQVFPIQDDLLLTTKGLIWGKDASSGGHILLGDASVALGSRKTTNGQLMP